MNWPENVRMLLGNADQAYEADDYEFIVTSICLVLIFLANTQLHRCRQLKRQMAARFNQYTSQSSIKSRSQLWLNWTEKNV